jgi:hypothetical protein
VSGYGSSNKKAPKAAMQRRLDSGVALMSDII